MALPAATAWLLTLMPWRTTTVLIGVVGLAAAAAILAMRGLPSHRAKLDEAAGTPAMAAAAPAGRGFWLLLAIAMIDSATRMGFLTFLPFLLKMKGADLPMIGIALTLIFAGGAAGKLVCRLARRPARGGPRDLCHRGADRSRDPAAAATAVDRRPRGVAADRDGAQRDLVGAVRHRALELVPPQRRQRAFSIFYTGGVGAGALAPVLYGLVSDLASVPTMMLLVAAVVLATLPLAWRLGPHLRQAATG